MSDEKTEDKKHIKRDGKKIDVVDEAGFESFPASDPPAWMGNASKPGDANADKNKVKSEKHQLSSDRLN